MDYTISNLDSRLKNYLETNNVELLTKTLFNSESAKYFTIQTGVTAEQPIVKLDSSIVLGDGSDCGFEAQGSDTFTNRMLKPEFLKVNKEFCPKELLKTWAHSDVKMNALGQAEAMPFETVILNSNLEALAVENERLIWEGDKTKTGNIAKMDGIITIAKADSNTVKQTKESDEVFARCQQIFLALNQDIADKAVIFMSLANFRKLIVELTNKNMFHVFEQHDGTYEMTLPATNVKIKGVSGITSDVIIATPIENLYLGVDAVNDTDTVDMYFDKSDRTFKMVIEYAYCTNYAYSEYILINE